MSILLWSFVSMLRGKDTLYNVVGCLMFGMAVVMHPIPYREPRAAYARNHRLL